MIIRKEKSHHIRLNKISNRSRPFGLVADIVVYCFVIILLLYVHGKQLWPCREGQLI